MWKADSRREPDMTSNESKIRVLIYSKHALFREGLRALLENEDSMEIVAEAATAKQALRFTERLHPNVLLLTPAARGQDGSDVTRRIKELDPRVKVLVLSFQDDEHLAPDYLTAGASAYIRKGAQPEQLRGAIYNACRGATYAA